ncbi:MAG: hypothetical protein Q9225_002322 [Loekoesia sp. 1 TL-2023]
MQESRIVTQNIELVTRLRFNPPPSSAKAAPSKWLPLLPHLPHHDTFTAKQAYDCLISVPFVPAVASRFIKYYNDTVQFHSTLNYLKNPPQGYRQPATDILKGLEDIQSTIDHGGFPNQYAFEATLLALVHSAHDVHFQLDMGILAAFDFQSPYSIISLSEDGIQDPKVYLTGTSPLLRSFFGLLTDKVDVFLSQESSSSFKPSAIRSVDGQDATEFLSQIAANNSMGNLEPHADWNDLMASQAAYIQNIYSVFESAILVYPGETITIAFENGTQLGPQPWMALYNRIGPTGPLATGGDFCNFFVLGLHPASFDPNAPDPCNPTPVTGTASEPSTTTDSSATPATTGSTHAMPSATSWPDSSYPSTADIFQPNLYPDGGGFVTGYFLKDISTAVLSIPTFEMLDNDTKTFSDTVGKFLSASRAAGMQKVLIDLQQNLGGDSLLAVDTFKHFFPSKDPFRGSRLRANPIADVLGNTFTSYFEANKSPNSSVYENIVSSEWVATDRLKAATGQNFTSWGEFFGPHEHHGDLFTTVQHRDVDTLITSLGINLRDQIRQDQPEIPIQFLYDAADCRIFYTAETWLNYTALWTYSMKAISNPALCVPQSTGYSQKGTSPPFPASTINNAAFDVSALTAKYTNEFTGLELGSWDVTVQGGKTRDAPQTCNNHGNDCSFGRCNLDLKNPGKNGTYHGRPVVFREGTCPSIKGGGGGGLKDLVTAPDQPAEINRKRGLETAMED